MIWVRSNVLFTKVRRHRDRQPPQAKGIEVNETADARHLHVGAGESWHQQVRFTRWTTTCPARKSGAHHGCVGSSPIQNIGAYGVELQRVCDYVDCVELETGEIYVCPRQIPFRLS